MSTTRRVLLAWPQQYPAISTFEQAYLEPPHSIRVIQAAQTHPRSKVDQLLHLLRIRLCRHGGCFLGRRLERCWTRLLAGIDGRWKPAHRNVRSRNVAGEVKKSNGAWSLAAICLQRTFCSSPLYHSCGDASLEVCGRARDGLLRHVVDAG